MTKQGTDERGAEELTEEELRQTDGEPLPDREAMSAIRLPAPFVHEPPIDWE